jgi:hypothetical protein
MTDPLSSKLQLTKLRELQTRLEVWPAAELEEVRYHEAVEFMRYAGEQVKFAADEIERLTEDLDTHLKVHLGVVRENVRLRAALEETRARIVDQWSGSDKWLLSEEAAHTYMGRAIRTIDAAIPADETRNGTEK